MLSILRESFFDNPPNLFLRSDPSAAPPRKEKRNAAYSTRTQEVPTVKSSQTVLRSYMYPQPSVPCRVLPSLQKVIGETQCSIQVPTVKR